VGNSENAYSHGNKGSTGAHLQKMSALSESTKQACSLYGPPAYWKAFKYKGVSFLAFRQGRDWTVIDDCGNRYGTFESVDSFKDFYLRDPSPVAKIRELSAQNL